MDRLRFDNISFGYGDRTLFEGLSLDIKKAWIASIIGPNGCGKSSLLKLASAIHKPWEGEISVFERKVGELRPKQRAQLIGHLSQEHSMPPMSVRKLVECGRHPTRGPLRRWIHQTRKSWKRPCPPADFRHWQNDPCQNFQEDSGSAPSLP